MSGKDDKPLFAAAIPHLDRAAYANTITSELTPETMQAAMDAMFKEAEQPYTLVRNPVILPREVAELFRCPVCRQVVLPWNPNADITGEELRVGAHHHDPTITAYCEGSGKPYGV